MTTQAIYDLWMRGTTSLDGALQLLLIIDWICDWAKEVYRYEVLCCLAGGARNIRAGSTATYGSRSTTLEPQSQPDDVAGESATVIAPQGDLDDDNIANLTDEASNIVLIPEDSVMEDDVDTEHDQLDLLHDRSGHVLMKWAETNSHSLAPPWMSDTERLSHNSPLMAQAHAQALAQDGVVLLRIGPHWPGSTPTVSSGDG